MILNTIYIIQFKILHSCIIFIFIIIRYTPKEDRKILMYMKNTDLNKRDVKYVELAKLLGRQRHSISKRYRRLKMELKSNNKSEAKRK